MGINFNFRKNKYDDKRRKELEIKALKDKQNECKHEHIGWFPDMYYCKDCGETSDIF